jgi:hypothetical protein
MFERLRRRFPIIAGCLLALATCAVPASAEAATHVTSRNWGGYAVRSKSGAKFRKVAGTWIVRKPDCATRSPGYSAAWVGIGGFGHDARKLEQTGTDADCTAAGHPRYAAWYELLPAGSKRIGMKVHAGDTISASVGVQGTSVTLRMRNQTTGEKFTKTTSMSGPDVTSAEWIVEAPSNCDNSGGNCTVLPLADFGTLPFSGAAATTGNGSPKAITNSSFSVFQIKLRSAGSGPGKPASSDGATASALSSGGSAFSVTYRPQVPNSSARARTFSGAH